MQQPTGPSGKFVLRVLSRRYGLVCVLAMSVCLNVFQGKRLGVFARPLIRPAVGTVAAPVTAASLSGEQVKVDMSGKPTILYYFSPQCGWCEKNWSNVKAIIAGTQARYRFVALSTSADIVGFLETRQLAFDVYTHVRPETLRAYDFGATPRTVVVDANGRVAHVWSGAYRGPLQAEVERVLGVVLPGLTTPKGSILRP